ncbi:hypothetical protein TUM4261_10680 [Shewanella sp. c952]|uniref:hypothetical protein n=1 Tax=Shewanella sp. c952 TaxID=2815913 RepID=UPI001BBB6D31|nr:hypothetical protein [Shewanella sp. c952]GIU06751.1 hypothetical protein TUM4261_10680 [Shewanella sp. c952]
MAKSCLLGYILVNTMPVSALKEALIKHIELTRTELGSLIFEASQDRGNEKLFI